MCNIFESAKDNTLESRYLSFTQIYFSICLKHSKKKSSSSVFSSIKLTKSLQKFPILSFLTLGIHTSSIWNKKHLAATVISYLNSETLSHQLQGGVNFTPLDYVLHCTTVLKIFIFSHLIRTF